MLRCQLLFLFFILYTVPSQSQLSQNNFVRYTTAQGLSHNHISAIAQDSVGYLWIATAAGLNRFNGNRFVQFHSNDDSLSLATEELDEMTWLDNHRLGIYTSAGLQIVDTRTGAIRNLFVPCQRQNYLYKYNTIVAAKADDKGSIYILTRSGFYHFKDWKLVWRYDHYTEKDLANTHFHFGINLLQLDNRRLLIVSSAGLYVYDQVLKQFKIMQPADCPLMDTYIRHSAHNRFLQHKPGHFFILKQGSDTLTYINTISNKKVYSRLPFNPGLSEFHFRSRLVAVSDSVLYITGQKAGFYKMRFYPESGKVDFYPQKYFSSFLCRGLLKDRDHQLWVATTKGLFREDAQGSGVQFTVLPAAVTDSFPTVRLTDVYTSADKIYAGNFGEAGLLVFDKKTFQFAEQIFFDTNNKGLNQINVLAPAGASQLLLGTNYQLLLFNLKTKKARPLLPFRGTWPDGYWINDFHKDTKGDIWISAGDSLYWYNPAAQRLIPRPIEQQQMPLPVRIKEDRKGNLWMASHGIARYNPESGKLEGMIDSFPFIKMPDRQINTFEFDQQNILWTSSNNNGLLAYDLRTKTFRHFTTRNGLPDNNVVALQQVDNKIWVACATGIACVDLTTFQIVGFGKEDGLPDMPVVRGAKFYYDSVSRQLYLCFTSAVARFDPDGLLQQKVPPHVFIEAVAINGQRPFYLPDSMLTTSWKDNGFTITIGSIGFSHAGSQRFAYRILNDHNTTTPWIHIDDQLSFSISELSSGLHRIQVKTYSLTGRWPEQVREICIMVMPPLWQKAPFLIAAGIALLVLLYVFIKWRITAVRKEERIKTEIQKLKADDYKAQFELEQISHYFSSSLSGKKTAEEVLWDVAENLIGRMKYEECIMYGWNETKTKMVQKAAYGPKGKPEIISSDVFEVAPGQGIVGHVIQTRLPELVNDTRKDNRYRLDDDYRLSEICVPILHNDELLGVIDSENSALHYFSERDIKILTTIATLIANKLKQIESEQSLEAKQRELANINVQLAEARLTALQAQMNPHFIFNALNSIKRMILDGDNEQASRYLSKFALMIRMTMEQSKEVFVTLDDNVEYLKAYLDMEQLRFGESFTYRIDIDEDLDPEETTIPSLMMQPLVENAIWHGLMQAEGEKRISITFSQLDNQIICTVEDNGIGISRSEKLREKQRPLHRSAGLQNLQKRIRIINEKYNTACRLDLEEIREAGYSSGTRAILQLNLITTSQQNESYLSR